MKEFFKHYVEKYAKKERGHTVSTIGEEKRWNPRFAKRSRESFIELMQNLNLPDPKKMMEAVPANERCGRITAIAVR
jgi:sugar (pentulose or hexulose) kinase